MEAVIDFIIQTKSNSVLLNIKNVLNQNGYTAHVARIDEPSKNVRKPDRPMWSKLPFAEQVINKKTKLLVTWWSKGDRWSWDGPKIILFKGILPKTWLVDVGLLGDSMLTDLHSGDLSPYYDEKCQQWSLNYCKYLMDSNETKRKQPHRTNLKTPKNFVFLPMQYSKDFSIKKHCSISYDAFVTRVAKFCSSNNLSLVIKHHPDIQFNKPKNVANNWRLKEIHNMNVLIKKCQNMGCKISVMNGSVHDFLQRCRFMAGMNTLCHVDAMINGCISFHCGSSAFMNSGAVIHNDDIETGMKKCLHMSDSEKRQLITTQKALVYYLYNKYAILHDDRFSSEWNNEQKINNVFDYVKKTGNI